MNAEIPAAPPARPRRSFKEKLIKHLRHGTLTERMMELAGVLPTHAKVRWRGADSPAEATRALSRWAELFLKDQPADSWVLSVGDSGPFHQRLNRALERRGVQYRAHAVDDVLRWSATQTAGIAGIVCGYADVAQMTRASRRLAVHPALSTVRFEYAAGINPELRQFGRHDEYAGTYFVAPGLLDSPTPYELYEESLQRFEQKCGLRDFLDLYQVLRYIVRNKVPGDIAEFGSYRGHSGYLIARTLQSLGSDKRLYMFDMFEEFPPEPFGVDHYWNQSHQVNFEEVRAKFKAFPNVTLVKGDFTQTLPGANLGPLALAYIDCDSYRGTRYLVQQLWDRHLAPRSALVCEDYGHPALLGSRAAIHEEFDARPDTFQFFSQFSGLYVVLKQ